MASPAGDCVWVVSLALSVVLRPPVRRLALSSGRRLDVSLLSRGAASLAHKSAAAAAGGASQALDERCGDDARRAPRFERSSRAAAATAFWRPQGSASAVSSQRRRLRQSRAPLRSSVVSCGRGKSRFLQAMSSRSAINSLKF